MIMPIGFFLFFKVWSPLCYSQNIKHMLSFTLHEEVAPLDGMTMPMHGLIVLMRFGRFIFLIKDNTKHCHNNYGQISYNIEFIQSDSKKT